MRLPEAMRIRECSITWKSIIVIIVLFMVTVSFAKPGIKLKYTGTFSSIHMIPESGDLLGEEIRIVYTTSGYQGILQIAEGGPEPLLLLKKIKFDGNKIIFDIPPDDSGYGGSFEGVISSEGITGTLKLKPSGINKISWPRRKSYWD